MDDQAIIDHIVSWLKFKLDSAGANGFVVGVSGGVDSALTSTLCALTKRATVMVSMNYDSESVLANKHMKFLRDNYINVKEEKCRIHSMVDSFMESVNVPNKPIIGVNVQSRVRMIVLYMYANAYDLLVAGTGNKVEDHGVGFFTKYGDGGVDISPIGDLLKSNVWRLAKFLGVHDDIINAEPTDGLWGDRRTDEDQLGATYDELEWAMKVDAAPNDDATLFNFNERQHEVYQIYKARHESTRHKMEMPPICRIPTEFFI